MMRMLFVIIRLKKTFNIQRAKFDLTVFGDRLMLTQLSHVELKLQKYSHLLIQEKTERRGIIQGRQITKVTVSYKEVCFPMINIFTAFSLNQLIHCF